ncbi:hypothetical protein SCP_0507290 [Sparassis crispa]|uniref:Uncharacterized protein n=1 Tax=Sparassis crispa TaxID=139825 RepID=A0A401GPJ1_9APHY|nr:hypothetical protein SCP_0507290 [Sparassis crispa]GBE83674.1 hypothetical protein SCP_0507290 [Sparassis crispa]
MTPATAAGVPLPASVASPSVHTRPISTKAQSVADAGANRANRIRSPKAQSRVLSPARTGGERPWSPCSVASHGQSLKSRNTQKIQCTVSRLSQNLFHKANSDALGTTPAPARRRALRDARE